MTPAFLTLPPAGRSSLPGLVRKLRLRAVRRLATAEWRGLPPAQGRAFAELQGRLPALLKADSRSVLEAVGAPDVLPQLLCMGTGFRAPEVLLADAIPHLLAALGTAPEALLWPGPIARIVDPSRSIAHSFEPPAALMVLDPTGLRVEDGKGRRADWGEGDVQRPFLPLASGAGQLALVDSNPLAMLEEHPDKQGNALDLGGHEASAWQASIDAALAIVVGSLPGWSEDLPLVLRRVIPVGWYPEMHLSASYREAPGIVYLSLHPSILTMAEAIVHECQHGKLNVLLGLDPVLENGHTTWTPSPVRPDLRPLLGVLLAVHAFVPVSVMHRELALGGHPLAAEAGFDRRRAQVLASNLRGLEILEQLSSPTQIGKRLLTDLRALHDACALEAPRVPGVDHEALPEG